ncbi:hypothetical protein DICPUDRAFT_154528 [Dictyostelium purpureum]|uniref:ILEI/PANDER domain-containing protein n=1 Tax=Dictyostelium purpureum TaxID=5786 RepID=F0ZRK4_DICPU|nr:uncharacterized protein DICPUDRAFT_154528 [Dictyostelium purpureum]EGC33422.1 hypothetical protein DICPUDRAFT_154528 [Dictyostelium purpureum]|eukprot:XP_003290041.1 hypothetical protein DICPUDRAFT_154528 [Dictyostelium purpureum]
MKSISIVLIIFLVKFLVSAETKTEVKGSNNCYVSFGGNTIYLKGRGINVITFDPNVPSAIEASVFDTDSYGIVSGGSSASASFLNYMNNFEYQGQIVLIVSVDDSASCLSNEARSFLKKYGIDSIGFRSSFVTVLISDMNYKFTKIRSKYNITESSSSTLDFIYSA